MPTEAIKDILPAGSLKQNINSYFNKNIKQEISYLNPPYLPPRINNPATNLYGNSTSSSNFGTKIRVQRDSNDESTRDDTRISKNPYNSKHEDRSKFKF